MSANLARATVNVFLEIRKRESIYPEILPENFDDVLKMNLERVNCV